MVESKSENGLLFALQCRWMMYIFYDKEINYNFTNLILEDIAAIYYDCFYLLNKIYN